MWHLPCRPVSFRRGGFLAEFTGSFVVLTEVKGIRQGNGAGILRHRRVREDIEPNLVAVEVLVGTNDKLGAAARDDTVERNVGVVAVPAEESSVDITVELLIGSLNDDARSIITFRNSASGDTRI